MFEAKLIVNQRNMTDRQGNAIISLKEANLSEMNFDIGPLFYISLSQTNLTRAVFHFSQLLCAHFDSAILIEANFHNADIPLRKYSCFENFGYTMFSSAMMTKVDLSQAQFIATDFSSATLDYANMQDFLCLDCLFHATKIYRSNLSFATISKNSTLTVVNITQATLHSAEFKEATFQYGEFSQSTGIGMKIKQCSFIFTIFKRCVFINVNFTNTITQNASFLNSSFQQSFMTDEQRLKAASFDGSVFF